MVRIFLRCRTMSPVLILGRFMEQSLRNNLLKTNENAKGIVLSNSPNVVQKGVVLYLPIYFTMFL